MYLVYTQKKITERTSIFYALIPPGYFRSPLFASCVSDIADSDLSQPGTEPKPSLRGWMN